MLIRDEDLVVRYLKSHRGPEPSDQLYAPFVEISRGNPRVFEARPLPLPSYTPTLTRGSKGLPSITRGYTKGSRVNKYPRVYNPGFDSCIVYVR